MFDRDKAPSRQAWGRHERKEAQTKNWTLPPSTNKVLRAMFHKHDHFRVISPPRNCLLGLGKGFRFPNDDVYPCTMLGPTRCLLPVL